LIILKDGVPHLNRTFNDLARVAMKRKPKGTHV
jgi:hypothetical protein